MLTQLDLSSILFMSICTTVSLVGVALELKHVIETNLITLSWHFISCYFHFSSHLKQLYVSNKIYSVPIMKVGMEYVYQGFQKVGLGYR